MDGVNWFRCECAPGFAGPDCRISEYLRGLIEVRWAGGQGSKAMEGPIVSEPQISKFLGKRVEAPLSAPSDRSVHSVVF